MDEIFTASQIADAVGVTTRAVRKRLPRTNAQKREAGKSVSAWPYTQLPGEWQAKIESMAVRDGCRDAVHFLAMPATAWVPAIPIIQIPEDAQEKAKAWRDLLAPVLSDNPDANLAVVARKARDLAATADARLQVSERSIERIIRLARGRTGNRLEFDRWEIYLSEHNEKICISSAPPKIQQGLTSAEQSDFDETAAFLMAFERMEELLENDSPKVAARKVLEWLESSLPNAEVRDTLRKRFSRAYGKWVAGGRTRLALKDQRGKAGRKVVISFPVTEQKILKLYSLKHGSFEMGIRYFFESDKDCSIETYELLRPYFEDSAHKKRRIKWPKSMRQQGTPTKEMYAKFRNEKKFSRVAFTSQRDMSYIDEKGVRKGLAPGDLYESDDMSLNQPYKFINPETRSTNIGRQSLCTLDVFSGAWLGGTLVGRAKDAYRVEDIMDHLLSVVQSKGLPIAWRLENGSWASKAIDGISLRDGSVWGGLGDLFQVLHANTSNGKGLIESSFNTLQSHMSHSSTDIGRSRGEFEKATKNLAKAANGHSAALSKVWDIESANEGLILSMGKMNQSPRQRRAFGRDTQVPDDLFYKAVKREFPTELIWYFRSVKREAKVRNGHVSVCVEHYPLPFRFEINGVEDGIHLDHGTEILISFHPGRPDEGCHIFKGLPIGSDPHGHEWKTRDFIMLAPLATDSPQFNLSRDVQECISRKRANAAVRSLFRDVVPIGGIAVKVSRSQDGYGNRSEVAAGNESFSCGRKPSPAKLQKRKDEGIEAMKAAKLRPQISKEELARLEAEFMESAGIFA